MTEEEYREHIGSFLRVRTGLLCKLVGDGIAASEPEDYVHFSIVVDYLRGGAFPFNVFQVRERSCEFHGIECAKPLEGEFKLEDDLDPASSGELPDGRYPILEDCVREWLVSCAPLLSTSQDLFAALMGSYKIFDLRRQVWVEKTFFH